MKRKWLEWRATHGHDVPSAKIIISGSVLSVPLYLLKGVNLGELLKVVEQSAVVVEVRDCWEAKI